ncbi:myocyte-specific enhancer factor 2C-like [Centruroides sculpturatus]|uniref:myocyte-specific enhancer factor 2C-like n=1 Tax=Centruroides sculpturatus TaxID=218467 RepID=UPI000C6D121B|nr:myocyte-specific enhancer factor 2C-like [Centruroides sculpturatus]XP_023219369.1 myocyte-specific enhancer factor 2C-like [Centruroides sculpturatus]XP_023219370.1 myocyte-specific enhancer factor 2C-like [Centruroides sculpturatus]XP_023219371.1 myocyte-specific enhancer factor 2C-like [Centruroides sculpturatus]XP_023219372.1 myocyte-specific enhancer factor 2C-like [Centruroides sculpturatus]
MGRKKIQISRITDERNRQVTFTKRKFGLMKKAYELSVLCDCEIALIIFNGTNKLFQYASTDMDKVLLKYTEYNEPHESRTNNDIVEALSKKEHKNSTNGCDSPEPDQDQYMTNRPDNKYNKISEEFDIIMQRSNTHMNGRSQPPTLGQSMVSLPVSSSTYHHHIQDTNMMQHSPQMPPHASVSPRPSSSGLIDMNGVANGYHRTGSPLSGNTSPALCSKGGLNKQHSPPLSGSNNRSNLRVIPNSHSNAIGGRPSNTSVSSPVVSMSTGISNMGNYPSAISTFPPNDFQLASDFGLSGLNSNMLHNWSSQSTMNALSTGLSHSSNHMSHLSVNTSNSNMSIKIKSEPISPPRDGMANTLQRPPSGHLSPGHSLTPSTSSSPDPNVVSAEYDASGGKRPRLTVEGWAP